MYSKIRIYTLIIVLLSAMASFAGQITGVSINPTTRTAGTQTTYAITFTTATGSSVPNDGWVQFTFSSGFNLTYVTSFAFADPGAYGGFDFDTFRITNDGSGNQRVRCQRDGTGNTIPSGGSVTINVSMVTNPINPSPSDIITIRTEQSSKALIDESLPGDGHVNIYGPIASFDLSNPGTRTAGQAFTLSVSNAVDGNGNPASGTILVSAASGAGEAPNGADAILQDIVISNGTGSANQTLFLAETGVVLEGELSSNASVNDATSAFTVDNGSVNSLDLDVPGTVLDGVNAGEIFNNVVVTALDTWENVVDDYNGQVYFATTSMSPDPDLPYRDTYRYNFVSGDNGSHEFDGFIFRKAGNHTLSVNDGSRLTTSGIIEVTAGNLASFNFASSPAEAIVGEPLRLTVSNATDAYGNPLSRSFDLAFVGGGNHTAPNGESPVLPSVLNTVDGSGYVDMSLLLAETGVQIQATSNGITEQTAAFNVVPGALNNFTFAGLPVSIDSAEVFPNNVIITAYDHYQNIKTNYSGSVSFSSTDTNPSVDLPSNSGLSNGIGTFLNTDFRLHTVGNQQITVRDPLDGITSTSNYIQVKRVPTNIEVLSVTPSQNTVTQNQTQDWTVEVAVRNNSTTNGVQLASDSTKTYIQFKRGAVDTDYEIWGPETRPGFGFTIPAQGTTYLIYEIKNTGSLTGDVNIFSRVATISGDHTTSTLDEVYAGVQVQAPENLEIVSVTPSQSQVVANDNYQWDVDVRVRNNGGSTIVMNFAQSGLVSNAVSTYNPPTAFLDQTTSLGLNETKTMRFTVTQTTTNTGVQDIDAQLRYQVVNTNESKTMIPGGNGSVLVQTASDIQITDIVPSQNRVTIGSSTVWTITMDVINNGGSDVELDLAEANTWVKFYNQAAVELTDVDMTWPTELEAGGTTLEAGDTGQLVFQVNQNTINAGTMNIAGRLQGTETNRTLTVTDQVQRTDPEAGTVIMQTPANIQYQAGSLQPRSAFPGNASDFQITLVNSGGSTVELDPAQTTFEFDDGSHIYSTTLDPAYGTTIAQGTTTIHFQSKLVPTGFLNDTYSVQVTLVGTENGGAYSNNVGPLSDVVAVGPEGKLVITAVRTSTNSVTLGQTNPWTTTIVVQNKDINAMQLVDASLTFKYSTDDVTDKFPYVTSTTFMNSGSNILQPDATDSIQVTINSVAGNAPSGEIFLTPQVNTLDNTDISRKFTDNLPSAAKVSAQTPANLTITDLYASQNTVTKGQDKDWYVIAVVENTGQSAVQLRTNSSLTISRNGFTVVPPNIFEGSQNNILTGGATDSVRFTITSINLVPNVGDFSIFATIPFLEINTNEQDSRDSNTILLKLQENAKIRLDAIYAELRSEDLINANQEFYIYARVSNAGNISNGDMVEQLSVSLVANNNGITFPNGNVMTIDSVAAGQTKQATVGVLASAPSLPQIRDVVQGTISSATARNTGTSAVIETPLSNTAEFLTQTPGELIIDDVYADNDTIVSGTQAPWNINVVVRNSGSGNILLKRPQDGDVSINHEGYIIKAQPDWTDSLLVLNERDTLRYTVTNTPSISGDYIITANIRAEDWNDASKGIFTKSEQTDIYFTRTSAVGITETYMSVSTPNVDENGVGLVNTNQNFNVSVLIENKADQALDSVRVRLTSSGSSVANSEIVITNIGFGEDKIDSFTVTAAGVEDLVGETLTAQIVHAYGRDGTQSKISPAEDDTVRIKIFDPAQLQIVSTTNLGPNPERKVSQGQIFPVQVRVANFGSEAAKDVQVSMATNNTARATVVQTPLTIDQEIAGGDTGTVVFNLQASNTATGQVNITSALFNASGKNNNQRPTFLDPGLRDTTFADLESKANMAITNVDADVNGEIIANDIQSPWNLYIELFNDGDADVQIKNPASSDITFTVDGQVDNTYDVRPPVRLRQSGDLILRSGETDTLAYSIAENGELAGDATIKVSIHGQDMNVGETSDLLVVDSTSVYVTSEATVQIKSTTITSNLQDASGNGLVNRNQDFNVRVMMRAGQLLGVDSVRIQLVSDGNSMAEPDTMVLDSIARDSDRYVDFELTADDSWPEIEGEKQETFTATILSAYSQDTKKAARVRQPDDEEDGYTTVRIQRPASIELEIAFDTSTDSLLAHNQEFDVKALVHNLGTAQATDGQVTLTPPEGYTIKVATDQYSADPVSRSFDIEDQVSPAEVLFTMKSPPNNAARRVIKGEITTIPLDGNSGQPVPVLQSKDSVYVTTSNSQLLVEDFIIHRPIGARDFEISTVQPLTLRAIVRSTPNLANRTISLKMPENLPGDVVYTLSPNTDETQTIDANVDTIDWVLTAPSVKFSTPHYFKAEATAVEGTNTRTSVDSVGILSVVNRPIIAIDQFQSQSAAGTNPQERESYFSRSQQNITLLARITNQGDAALIGNGTIELDLGNSSLTLTSDYQDKATQTFNEDNQDITWVVNAGPNIDSNGDDITVTLRQAPDDENTNEDAKLADDAYRKTMRVYITDLGKVRIVNRHVAITDPRGAQDNTISTEQTFRVSTEVSTNNIEENSVQVRLMAPQEYLIDTNPKQIPLGQAVQVNWLVTAPGEPHLPTEVDTFYVVATGIDANSGNLDTHISDTLLVHRKERTTFRIDPSITWPDSNQQVVSTNQEFDLTAHIRHSGASYSKSDSFVVHMQLPSDFKFANDDNEEYKRVYRFAQFDQGQHPTWRIIAPASKPLTQDFSSIGINLVEVARDTNSNEPGHVVDDSVRFQLRVVPESIVRFDVHVDGQMQTDTANVRIGSTFNALCTVTNLGDANFIDNFRVKINLPTGYTMADTNTVRTARIRDGKVDTLVWPIKAPNTTLSGLSNITFTLVKPPNDDFSRKASKIENNDNVEELKVLLETGKLIVQAENPKRTDESLNNTVVKGSKDQPIFRLVVQNKVAGRTFVRKVFFTLQNRDNEVLDPTLLVNKISAYRGPKPEGGYQNAVKFVETTNFTNTDEDVPGQIMLDFQTLQLDTLTGTSPDTIDITVDLKDTETFEDFRLVMSHQYAIKAVDDNAKLLELADVNGNKLETFQAASDLMVAVEGDFDESFKNYPNPFGRSDRLTTKFIYNLETDTDVTLLIFTLTGDLVLKKEYLLQDGATQCTAGLHQDDITWDGRNGKGNLVMNGVYLAYLRTGDGKMANTKIAVVK